MSARHAAAPVTAPPARRALPPGQRRVEGFPRFGTHLHRPPPAVPADPAITISGAGIARVALPVDDLGALPRQQLTADFHCVSGWSATDLRWDGVAFATLYRDVIEPALPPDTRPTHVVFGGLDGFESLVLLEDALADDVLIADRLDGLPLPPDHGAPVRLVSPGQYGYMSTKHLCSIVLHTSHPTKELGSAGRLSQIALRGPLVKRHPRARVAEEERHPNLPARLLRPVYRLVIAPGIRLCAVAAAGRPDETPRR